MSKRYRLTVRAEMHGAIREPGYQFTLAEGELGPHRTVVASDHGSNADGNSGRLIDQPLYVEVVEDLPREEAVEVAPETDLPRDDQDEPTKPVPARASFEIGQPAGNAPVRRPDLEHGE